MISSAGNVAGRFNGIRAVSLSGAVAVESQGNITTTDLDGIYADSTTSTTAVTSNGDIFAGDNGIRALGETAVSVDSIGDITATDLDGIFADSVTSTTTVTSNGNILAGGDGIDARGALDMIVTSVGDIEAGTRGIFASSSGGPLVLVSEGDITAQSGGIIAEAAGPVNVTSTGDVASTGQYGISVNSSNASATVVSNGAVSGFFNGIVALGNVNASITSTGDVTATSNTGDGVLAIAATGQATITSNGNVVGGDFGIRGESDTGTTILSTGDVTGTASAGIRGFANNGFVSITSQGTIAGQTFGIFADGDTAVTVSSTGNIIADDEDGIFAFSYSSTTTVTSEGNVTGGEDGIRGIGDTGTTIVSTGNVTGTNGFGIFSSSDNGSVSITSQGDVSGGEDGVNASSETGATIVSTGDVTGTNFNGIYGFADNGFVSITSEGDVAGGQVGIEGSGDTGATIVSTGDVTGISVIGIVGSSANGDVNITSHGNVSGAFGGISAGGNTGTVITTSGGVVSGGFYGVRSTAANGSVTINNLPGGTIRTDEIGGAFVFAIDAVASGGTTVNNTGIVTGDINFFGGGAGASLFDNQDGGLFNSGPNVNLGDGNLLRNAGTLSPGGEDAIQTTELTGNITQTGSGVFQVDVDQAAATADRFNATGTAELDGNVRVRLQNGAPGEQSVTILSAAGGTTDNGIEALASPILQASLSFPNPTDVVLSIEVDFTPVDVDLNINQTNLAENLNESFNAGGGGLEPVLDGLLNGVVSIPDYVAALDEMLPEIYLNTETAALFAAEEFKDNLLSCPKAGAGFTAVSQGQCMWVRYDGRWLDRDSTFQYIGFDEDAHGISGGAQVAVAPNWFLGAAATYEAGDLDNAANASADSDRYMLGGVVKYQSGPVLMSLAGAIGANEVNVARRIGFGGFNATTRSSYDVDHAGATFHAAYLMERSSWYAKPFIDVNVTHIDRESTRETGGGAANLNVSGSSKTYFSVIPALELGATIERSGGRAIRPYVRAGVTFYGDTDQSLTARFANAPASVGSFQTLSEFDDIFADIEAGVTLFDGAQHTVSAGYEGRFSDDTDIHGVFIKGTRKF